MPYATIEELRASPLYERMASLRALAPESLQRFLATFNAVYARVVKNGGAPDEAESKAVAISLDVARGGAPRRNPLRTVEAATHFVVPMMPEQLGAAGGDATQIVGRSLDFSLVREHLETVRASVRDREFNYDHDRRVGLGVVRDVVLPSDAADVEVPADAPFLLVASYYADVPKDIREIRQVSAEWFEAPLTDGTVLALPHTFAVTPAPLNGAGHGIGIIASATPGAPSAGRSPDVNANLHDLSGTVPSPMTQAGAGAKPDAGADATAAIASLRKDLDAGKAENDRLQKEYAAVKASLESITTGLAGLVKSPAGAEPKPDDLVKSVSARVASLEQAHTATVKEITAMRVASLKSAASAFADSLVRERKIKTEDHAVFASLHEANPEHALKVAAALVPVHPASDGQANVTKTEPTKEESEVLASLRSHSSIIPVEVRKTNGAAPKGGA